MNILIVDDHPLTCQGLSALMEATQKNAQVRSVHTAAQARESLRLLSPPDWIFLDINLPDDPKHIFFHEICANHWIGKTVLISAEPEHRLIHTALAAGARGFIPKTAEPDVVLHGFAMVLAGEFYLPAGLAAQLKHMPIDLISVRHMSPRLQQVQELLLRGVANKVIARELNLSAHTVKEYVSSVLAFHGVNSRLNLVLKLASDAAS
jgi:two-component system, NarL family, nitrate/nitrite response regulator NarL